VATLEHWHGARHQNRKSRAGTAAGAPQ